VATVTCRHCGHPIEHITAGWTDADGFFACVKAPLESSGHGRPAGFVLHEPMPDGMRGAVIPAAAGGDEDARA
jgi:hypothetical protein